MKCYLLEEEEKIPIEKNYQQVLVSKCTAMKIKIEIKYEMSQRPKI